MLGHTFMVPVGMKFQKLRLSPASLNQVSVPQKVRVWEFVLAGERSLNLSLHYGGGAECKHRIA